MSEIKHISSLSNPDIKAVRTLAQRKYREQDGLFVTEGLRHALEAAEAGWEFKTLLIEEGEAGNNLIRRLINMSRCPVLEVTAKVMESVTKRDNAQAVVAVLKQKWIGLKDIKPAQSLWIALEEIRDPGNLGTIMRTADATGAAGIILIDNTCDPYSTEAVRASMGSFARMALARCTREEFLAWLPGTKFQSIGTHLKTDHDYRAVKYKRPLLLVMGNEQAGLTDALSQSCTTLVKIPMRGKAELAPNVSVATAIMLYEVTRDAD